MVPFSCTGYARCVLISAPDGRPNFFGLRGVLRWKEGQRCLVRGPRSCWICTDTQKEGFLVRTWCKSTVIKNSTLPGKREEKSVNGLPQNVPSSGHGRRKIMATRIYLLSQLLELTRWFLSSPSFFFFYTRFMKHIHEKISSESFTILQYPMVVNNLRYKFLWFKSIFYTRSTNFYQNNHTEFFFTIK